MVNDYVAFVKSIIITTLILALLVHVAFIRTDPIIKNEAVVDVLPENSEMNYELLHQKKHLESGQHNTKYDHEQFLGAEEAKKFDELLPEESVRRLGIIVDKIDEDKDGYVTKYELKQWILYTKRRYIDEDVHRQWQQINPNGNETISWYAYRQHVYGFLDNLEDEEEDVEGGGLSYKYLISRDRRRWAQADRNLDDALDREEFTMFTHPEENPIMAGVILDETIEDIDKNKDGKVSLEEYIGDMYTSDAAEPEPEWVENERESFRKFRDADGDGYLNREEVQSWVVPKDFDHADSEAVHLIFEADVDGDSKLTKAEILDKYDIFVGSQATDFGEALVRHDEF